MPGNIASDKMESVRETVRVYNNFMKKPQHTNEEYRVFVNSFFVTPERKNILSLLINKANMKKISLDSQKSFKLLFSMWADKEFSLYADKLQSEEAMIGIRLGG